MTDTCSFQLQALWFRGERRTHEASRTPPGSIRIWAFPTPTPRAHCSNPQTSGTLINQADISRPPGPHPPLTTPSCCQGSTGGLRLVPDWLRASEVCSKRVTENGPLSKTSRCPATCRGEQTDAVQPSWSSWAMDPRTNRQPLRRKTSKQAAG